MRCKVNGFTLLECLVYLACTLFCCTLFVSFAVQQLRSYANLGYASDMLIGIASAQSIIAHKLSAAHNVQTQWLVLHEHALIWRLNDIDFGLVLEGKRLVYMQGTFDVQRMQWLAKTKATILDAIDSLQFLPVIYEKGIGITCSIMRHGIILERFYALRPQICSWSL